MESASLGIPILMIDSLGEIPVLLKSENFMDGFKTNFSERNIFEKYSYSDNLNDIIKIIVDKKYYDNVSAYSRYIYTKYFDIDYSLELYSEVYSSAIKDKRKLIRDSVLILRTIFAFFKNYIKKRINA